MRTMAQEQLWGARWRLIAPRTYVLYGADGQRLREVERIVQPGGPVRYQTRGEGHAASEHPDLREAMAAAEASLR